MQSPTNDSTNCSHSSANNNRPPTNSADFPHNPGSPSTSTTSPSQTAPALQPPSSRAEMRQRLYNRKISHILEAKLIDLYPFHPQTLVEHVWRLAEGDYTRAFLLLNRLESGEEEVVRGAWADIREWEVRSANRGQQQQQQQPEELDQIASDIRNGNNDGEAAEVDVEAEDADVDDDDHNYSLTSVDEEFVFDQQLQQQRNQLLRTPTAAAAGETNPLTGSPFVADELPIFRCQTMSPGSRSISPIDVAYMEDELGAAASQQPAASAGERSSRTSGFGGAFGDEKLCNFSMSPCGSFDDDDDDDDDELEQFEGRMEDDGEMSGDRISLQELHARLIGSFKGCDGGAGNASPESPVCPVGGGARRLETIVEGVFLETPPQRRAWRVGAQSICKFVEDQARRRCYDEIMEMEQEVVEEEAGVEGAQAGVAGQAGDGGEQASVGGGDVEQLEAKMDRMLSIGYETKTANMC